MDDSTGSFSPQSEQQRRFLETKVRNIGSMFIIVGAVSSSLYALAFTAMLLGLGTSLMGAVSADADALDSFFDNLSGIGTIGISLAAGGLIIYAGMELRKLRNHSLALAASIVSLVPVLSPCCCITLPFGIWALVNLNKYEIKQVIQ